eukprot:gb/GEZN01004055.1/.p1 GENE.gb/GEZN01004055.1/~~gb/GEZN01004055.1/.p1  ORF type:complete len:551 (+),score=52.69 gb/GEZN01004055.1/:119-1771(+)
MVVHITIPRTHGEKVTYKKATHENSSSDSVSVQRAKKVGVAMINGSKYVKSIASTYTVYEVQLQGSGIDKIVNKRWSDFKAFDQTWRKLYPNVHKLFFLPRDTLQSLVAKNSRGVTSYRREGLEIYLQGLAKVTAVQPLMELFLELQDGSLHRNTAKKYDLGDAKKTHKGATSPGDQVKMLSPEELSAKGNTDMAALKALQQQEKFIEKHEGILDSLMPGRKLNLNPNAYGVPHTAMEGKRELSLGELKLSIYFDPAGGKTPSGRNTSGNKGRLVVEIYSAKDVAVAADAFHLTSDSYAKVYLKPDPDRRTKLKTSVVTRTQNPVYNESFEYIMPAAELDGKTVEVSVWGKGAASVGGIGIGQCLGVLEFPGPTIPKVPSDNKPAPSWRKLGPPPLEITTKVVKGTIRSGAKIAPPSGVAPAANKLDPFSEAARRLRSTPPQGEYANKPSPYVGETKNSRTTTPDSSLRGASNIAGPSSSNLTGKLKGSSLGDKKGLVKDSYWPASDETDVLQITQGQIADLLDVSDTDWWLVKIDGTEGYVPADCLERS